MGCMLRDVRKRERWTHGGSVELDDEMWQGEKREKLVVCAGDGCIEE